MCVVEKHTHSSFTQQGDTNVAQQRQCGGNIVYFRFIYNMLIFTALLFKHRTHTHTHTHVFVLVEEQRASTHTHPQSKCDDTNVEESVNRRADVLLTESHKLGLDFTIPDFPHHATRGSVL